MPGCGCGFFFPFFSCLVMYVQCIETIRNRHVMQTLIVRAQVSLLGRLSWRLTAETATLLMTTSAGAATKDIDAAQCWWRSWFVLAVTNYTARTDTVSGTGFGCWMERQQGMASSQSREEKSKKKGLIGPWRVKEPRGLQHRESLMSCTPTGWWKHVVWAPVAGAKLLVAAG